MLAGGVVPRVTFADSQVRAVGRTEAVARAAGLDVTVVRTATGDPPGADTPGMSLVALVPRPRSTPSARSPRPGSTVRGAVTR